MLILAGEKVEEVKALLTQLQEEDDIYKEMETTAKAVRLDISQKVKKLAVELGGKQHGRTDRILLPAGDSQYWDRRVSGNKEQLDLELLEKRVGIAAFQKLCDRVVVYELNPNKLENARKRGIITEQDMTAATVRTKITFSLYRIDVSKVEEDDEG